MNSPEVKFYLPTVKNEAEKIFMLCYNKKSKIENLSDIVYKYHPKLKEMTDGVSDRSQFYGLCYEYVKDFLKENKVNLDGVRDSFQKSWNETKKIFLTNLSKDFETDFPQTVSQINVTISINPVLPRNLEQWSFNVYYKSPSMMLKSTCIHEIIHFLYFKKWKEVFPDCDEKNFNPPNPEWILSEILVHSIMNNNKTIQEIIKNEKSDVYPKWQSVIIKDKKLPDYFEPFYKEHEEGKISFADFLKKSWEEYQKHKETIEQGIK